MIRTTALESGREASHRKAHVGSECIGILLVNSGTPDSTSTSDVGRFLGGLLSDPRVVELPRFLWLPILHGIILRSRPFRSARKYRKIWTDKGSPLLVHSLALRDSLEQYLCGHMQKPVVIELGMLYSSPSIDTALQRLRDAGVRRLLVIPMFPQYSAVTAAATFDQVAGVLKNWRWIPEMRFVNEYHDHPSYISAVANSVRRHFEEHGQPQHLVMSYHGIPEKYFEKGDPYYCKCQKSSRLIAEELELAEGTWSVAFQSRYGPGKWLGPYTDEAVLDLPKRGVREVAVVCPGFAADCLETLEEIAIELRDLFIDAGGTRFEYIPALNSSAAHAKIFADLASQHLLGWSDTNLSTDNQKD